MCPALHAPLSPPEAPQAGVPALSPPRLSPGSHFAPARWALVAPQIRPDPPACPQRRRTPRPLASLPFPRHMCSAFQSLYASCR